MSCLSAVLLWLAWPPMHLNFLIFIAFVPLLAVEENVSKWYARPKGKVLWLSFNTFLLWNIFTTYWVWYASEAGATAAFVLNSLLMCLAFTLYRRLKSRTGNRWLSYLGLICFWLSYEMLHLNWDAPWPWLNLGNDFATSTGWVQWYEYTGTLGGSAWIWLVNILIYETIAKAFNLRTAGAENNTEEKAERTAKGFNILIAASVLAIALPIIVSYLVRPKGITPAGKANMVAVQPNIDPYNDKFDPATYSYQIHTLIDLSEKQTDSNTVLVAWPETAIAQVAMENEINNYPAIKDIRAFLKRHPKIKLITGITSQTDYQNQQMHSATARPFADHSAWYDVFNTAMLLDSTDHVEFYHKSKLVPGVEKMPYPRIFGFLENLAINLGGSSGSLGSQDSPSVFRINDTITAAPVICYESVFGEYVSRYVREGADLIAIITNDGWWKNSPGYRQHLYYGALRAIETRKMIIRAANTGVSCFILPSGAIIQPTGFWVPASIKSPLYISHSQTFYTKHGDYMGRIALIITALLYAWLVYEFAVSTLKRLKKQ